MTFGVHSPPLEGVHDVTERKKKQHKYPRLKKGGEIRFGGVKDKHETLCGGGGVRERGRKRRDKSSVTSK